MNDSQHHKAVSMQIDLKVLVLTRSVASGSKLNFTLAQMPSLHYELRVHDGDTPLADLDGDPPDVIILEVERANSSLLDDIRQFVQNHGHATEVFAIFPAADVKLVTELVRCGVRDVIPQPVTTQELKTALANSQARQRRPAEGAANRGFVTGFLKARGNAGGTFMATNVAYLLATEFHKNTALVDLDVQFGTVGSNLDIHSDGNILEALENPDRIDAVYLDALMHQYPGGLRVLPSPPGLGAYEQLTASAISRLLAVLAQNFDHVVLSLPAYINEGLLQAIRRCDPVYLVTQDTVSSLSNLKMLIQHLSQQGIAEDHMRLIHNRVGGAVKDIDSAEFQRLFGKIPVYRVRSDYRSAATAENMGKPACQITRSGITQDISQIAAAIARPFKGQSPGNRRRPRLWFT